MRMTILLVCILLLLLTANISGHNWILHGSRCEGACTKWPFPPKIGDVPHVQLSPNQNFTVDWSQGHGNNKFLYSIESSVYFVILAANDTNKIPVSNGLMQPLIKRYIDEAQLYNKLARPYYFRNLTNKAGWKRNHVLPAVYVPEKSTGRMIPNTLFFNPASGTGGLGSFDVLNSKYFSGQIFPNSSAFITRFSNISNLCKQNIGSTNVFCVEDTKPSSQWGLLPNTSIGDIRLEYQHPDPALSWIEAVHRFPIQQTDTAYTQTYSVANFRIPARKGPGNYILWYMWTAYADAIDISVHAKDVKPNLIYGDLSQQSYSYTRVDHCEFNYNNNAKFPCRYVDPVKMNVTGCVQDCASDPTCKHIQVSRVTNLANTLVSTVNVPFVAFNDTAIILPAQKVVGPCGYYSTYLRAQAGCKLTSADVGAPSCLAKDFPADGYMCFTSAYLRNNSLQATPNFQVINEPEDPIFYSTCLFRTDQGVFLPHDPYPAVRPSWKAGDSNCIPCSYLKSATNLGINRVPNWEQRASGFHNDSCMPC
jgi:hypothetical protein